MTNIQTIKAITVNLKTLLKGLGINFTEKTDVYKKNNSASVKPVGSIYYKSEAFEHGYGGKAYYINAGFTVTVQLTDRNDSELIRQQQTWVHEVREALTVDGLNVGELVEGKPVTRILVEKVAISNDKKSSSSEVSFEIVVRYREV